MTKVEQFVERVRAIVPDADVEIDVPRDSRGVWWIDVSHEGNAVTVDWRPRRGFGVSSDGSESYGERSDEVHSSPEQAASRVCELLHTGEATVAPRDMVLRRIREDQQITQADLARVLGVSQAAVSKMEGREDLRITTLRKVILALGGQLELIARFGDREVRILQAAE